MKLCAFLVKDTNATQPPIGLIVILMSMTCHTGQEYDFKSYKL